MSIILRRNARLRSRWVVLMISLCALISWISKLLLLKPDLSRFTSNGSVKQHASQSSSNISKGLNSTLIAHGVANIVKNGTGFEYSLRDNIESPRVVFHVGPPKTATSSIQCSLVKWSKARKLNKLGIHVVEVQSCRPERVEIPARIRKYRRAFPNISMGNEWKDKTDLYSYESIVAGMSWLPRCLQNFPNIPRGDIPTCWSESYSRYITNHYKRDNITKFIFSNENIGTYLSRHEPKHCGYIFDGMLTSLGSDFQIDIIFTQRYFWEFLVSFYHEQAGNMYRPKLMKWPGQQGGIKLPTIMEYIMDKKPMDIIGLIRCLRFASDQNPRVHLKFIDYHAGTDILLDFLNLLSIEKRDSNILIEGNKSLEVNTKRGKKSSIIYDRVAVAAFEAKWFNNSDRFDVRHKMEEFYENKGDTFKDTPYICPPLSFNDYLLNESITVQKEVFPDQSQEDLESKLISRFEKAVNSTLLCDANITFMMEDGFLNNYSKTLS